MTDTAALFLSHGSPMTVIEDSACTHFLRDLGRDLDKPRAAVVMSAHWPAAAPKVGAAANPRTIHDFSGFPPALYDIRYPAVGAPDVAARVAELLGPDCGLDASRGLDHGVWAPALLMWPEADVPLVPLTVLPNQSPAAHYDLGRRLRPLTAEGVLLIGSGAATHNLGAYVDNSIDAPPAPWVTDFTDWLETASIEDLLDYRRRAPHAVDNHPTEEHLLPLFFALGAGAHRRRVHQSVEYGVIAMDCYAVSG
jgi:4,5-DOPA dioxygenase extradiol